MRIRCWVRAISSRWTELTSSSCSRVRSRSVAADGEQLLLAVAAGRLDGGAGLGGAVDRHLELGQDDADGDADRLGRPALADQPLPPLDRPGPRLALGLGGADQGVGATVQGPGPLLAGAQRQAGVHLGLAGGAGRVGEPLALGGVGLLVGGASCGRGEPALELGQPGEVAARAPPGRSAMAWAMRSASDAGGARLRAVVPELLGHGGERGVGLVQLGQRDVDAAAGRPAARTRGGEMSKPEPLGRGDRLGQRGRGLVVRRLDLEQAGLALRAAGGEVGAVARRRRGSPR